MAFKKKINRLNNNYQKKTANIKLAASFIRIN